VNRWRNSGQFRTRKLAAKEKQGNEERVYKLKEMHLQRELGITEQKTL